MGFTGMDMWGPLEVLSEQHVIYKLFEYVGKGGPRQQRKTAMNVHGCKFKISKILNFKNSNFKTCWMPTKMNSLSLNGYLCLDYL